MIVPLGLEEVNGAIFAKGVGDATTPIKMMGAMKVKAGEVYDTFTGFTGIILTEQCGIAINKTVIALVPERTAIDVTTANFQIMFDKSTIIIMTGV